MAASNTPSIVSTAGLFACQKCRKYIRVDPDRALSDSAVLAFQQHDYVVEDLLKKREAHAIELLGESFVVLPSTSSSSGRGSIKGSLATSDVVASLDRQMNALINIFEVASDKAQLDHPLCVSCNEEVHKLLDRKLKDAETERDDFKLKLERLTADLKVEVAPAPLPADDRLERELEAQLAQIKLEREALIRERRSLEEESKQLDGFEQRFWEDYQEWELNMQAVSDETNSVRQQVKVANERLERMKRTNVYDDAFHISYDGHFGTINGFRLGRLASQQVDWQETNAALGQVLLLLSTIAKQANYKFTKHKLIPMGSFSKMCALSDLKTEYELYGSNDYSLGRLFWYRRFDTALTWLLQCIKELGDHAGAADKRFKLKYPIKDDRIGDVSVKLQFNQDAKWTKALKYMLTNLKFLLVWVSKRSE